VPKVPPVPVRVTPATLNEVEVITLVGKLPPVTLFMPAPPMVATVMLVGDDTAPIAPPVTPVETDEKPDPVMTTEVPAGPLDGEMLVMVGATTVNVPVSVLPDASDIEIV